MDKKIEYEKLLLEKMTLEILLKHHTEFQLMPSDEYQEYINDALEMYKKILKRLKELENGED